MKLPGVWMVTLPPMTVETKCSVEVREEAGAAINLQDVIFGDVWFCGGQVTAFLFFLTTCCLKTNL